ncbi:MAG TPA: alpha-amylase family protein, partial [Spirochaetota bacterium]|nr:alpha-amylase family protein [Spirochaetota bacterium]
MKQTPGDMVNYRTGWYKKEIANTNSVTFLFNDGTWSKTVKDNGNDFVTTSHIWVSKNGSKSYTDPFVVTTTTTTTTTIYNGPTTTIQVSEDPMNLRIYQVMVSSFMDGAAVGYGTGYGPGPHNGDLRGIINSLNYIKGLGMNAIWLTPIFDSEGGGQLDSTGYFTKNYFQIDPKFGTLDDAKELVREAHKLGMYVFLDGVFGHHKGDVRPSPTGKTPTGGNNPVSYPGSLEFYKEVATYWIDELEIDGWRLDQAYQVANGPHDGKYFQDKNYWQDIRKTVEQKCAQRKASGKQWGILGYMVGEIWDGGGESIKKNAYDGYNGEKGLLSCFDFPGRYKLVQTLAAEESKMSNGGDASALNGLFSTPDKISGVMPNMFLTNHDVVRLGDLIQRKGLGEYWERHYAALS